MLSTMHSADAVPFKISPTPMPKIMSSFGALPQLGYGRSRPFVELFCNFMEQMEALRTSGSWIPGVRAT
ncbi:hypothetical protein GUJ93_ZPchr0006g41242 [Zizania palustris]|uniref:Uncharacterized protein n=1 Tax=Zizania palustris TaxID=103762 RepID=A0A8J5W3W4_ZIZPA|nr:hypothetical protein GUJ93_ZPchr0006g41242 [Zizania palustris]